MNVSDPMLVLAKVHLDYDAVKSCDNRHELPLITSPEFSASTVRLFAVYYLNSHLYNALSRAYSNTCGFTMMADAIDTESFIDNIAVFSWRNSGNWAFWFAGSTKNAGIGNTMCHNCLILVISINKKGFKQNMNVIHCPISVWHFLTSFHN